MQQAAFTDKPRQLLLNVAALQTTAWQYNGLVHCHQLLMGSELQYSRSFSMHFCQLR